MSKVWFVTGAGSGIGAGVAKAALTAADLDLGATDLAELDSASAAIEVQGARYPEAMQRLIDK